MTRPSVEIRRADRYYTDETRFVTRADAVAGVKDSWNSELNNPSKGVTYNATVYADGGLTNTFTMRMDNNGTLHAEGTIRSTFEGPMNRNTYQQLKVGRLGGFGYQGGHAAPSALGFPGERIGLFAQHRWQNTGSGAPLGDPDAANFHALEIAILSEFKALRDKGKAPELGWIMTTIPGSKHGVPDRFTLVTQFSGREPVVGTFDNRKAAVSHGSD